MYQVRSIWLATCLALALAVLAGSVAAGIPQKINYQGRLVDNVTGGPRVGSHSMIFRLYDAASGGAELWSENQVVVADSAGVFSAVLGTTDGIDLAFDGPVWFEVEVSGEVLAPRRELASVPYAFRALRADSLEGFSADEFVMKGELASITAEMVAGGAGSGLDADMVDGLGADAFAGSSHVHDERYYVRDSLNTAGEVNDAANPVDWTRLKSVPAGFADGTDDVGEAADGYSLDADDGNPVDALYIDSEGDVGIGTASPAEKLEVAGTVHSTSGGFKFPDGTVQSTAVTGVGSGGGWVDDSTAVRLESPGDSVGIGTAAPQAKLDVAGTVRMEGFSLPPGADSGFVLTSDAVGGGTWRASPIFADTAHNHNDLYYTQTQLNTSDGDAPNVGANRVSWDNLTDVPAGFADGSDEVGGSGDGHSLDAVDGDPADVVYVDEWGYVGIGMDPEVKLDIHETNAAYCYLRLTNGNTGTGLYDGTKLYIQPGGSASLRNYEAAPLDFGTDGDTRMTIAADGNVGIGTYAPLCHLHLHEFDAGEGCFQQWTNDATGTVFDDGFAVGIDSDGNAYVNNYENTGLNFATNNNIRMHIKGNGRVGIGTLGPEDLMHVHLPNIGDAFMRFTNNTTGLGMNDGFRIGIDEDGDASLWSYETRYFRIGTGNMERLRITNTGDIGIGTYNPYANLHVHEGGIGGCFLALSNAGTGSVGGNGFSLGISADGMARISNYENNAIQFETQGNTAMVLSEDRKLAIGGLTGFSANLHVATTSPSESSYVRLTNGGTGHTVTDGLVMGIDPIGNAFLKNLESAFLRLGAGNDPGVAIGDDGNVAIGTLYSNDRLHLHHSTGGQPCFQRYTVSASGTGFSDGLKIGLDGGGHAYVHNYENTDIRFATNNNSRMIIKSGGNVGIGDQDPTVKLAVTGIARIQDLAAWPSSGTGMELAYDENLHRGYVQVYDRGGGGWGTLSLGSGNVGIGTGNPAVKLEVKGEDPFLGLNTTVNKTGLRFQKNGVTEWEVAWNEGSGYLYFYNSGTRLAIEDATGDVGIGTASPGYKLQVGNTGDGTEARANAWNTFSSRECKSDIRKLEPREYRKVLDDVRRTDVVRYRYREDGNRTEHIGVIAEDAPLDITTPDRKAVELADYSAFLLAAIKAQQEQIEALKAEVKDLKSQLGFTPSVD